MKKFFASAVLALLACIIMPAKAQEIPQLPVDDQVRIGKLTNGLTYYIRHNEYPKGQADFYIAQKVGSILEDDNQRGLAHFLEHMCFNGTTHFPGKNLINYLESIGVKFGANLNAYTSVDQTVYNISNVPVARQGVQDSCLLILHDWANDLLLLPEEIDAERGVIHQEWRRSMVGQMRILESILPTMYPGSPYGYRLPIGTMEVVDNFPPQALRDYYEKWYRPDQQGIIVVGDIDVAYIENKIKEMFSSIEMPENPAERVYFPVGDNEGTIIAIGHDKEQNNSIAQLFIKTPVLPTQLRNTQAFYVQNYMTDVITSMMDTRLNDISSKPDAPFAAAGMGYGNFFLAKTSDAFTLFAMAKSSDQLPSAIAAAYRELLRAVKGGFTDSEYERAKNEILSRYEKEYNNRQTRENNRYVQEYVDNFLDNEPIPGVEVEYEMMKQIVAMIPVATVNQVLQQRITPDNRVLMAMMPDNAEGVYPTEQQFRDALQTIEGENIEAFKENLKTEPLIENLRPAGKIVKETPNAMFDATELTLSNGVKVIVKHTEFKKDEIAFQAVALNGTSSLPDSYANSLIFMPVALHSCGYGTYTNADMQKYLAGKQVSVNPSFSAYKRTISGSSTPKDIETFFELLYSAFTQINFSADEFKALQSTYEGVLHNQESNPQYIFSKVVLENLYNSPRLRALGVESVTNASREQIVEICKQMTANAAEFTFVFSGNTDLATLKPLLEKYVASLPANAKKAAKNNKVKINKSLCPIGGELVAEKSMKMETPQTYVYIDQFGTIPFTQKDNILASVAGQILSKRLLDIVREDMGAVYSIGAYGSLDAVDPVDNAEVLTQFPMKPEMKDQVLKVIAEQFHDVTVNVGQEELSKVKEYLVKSTKENLEKNNYWIRGISNYSLNGVNTITDAQKVIEGITTDDVKAFMTKLEAQKNYRTILLTPAE